MKKITQNSYINDSITTPEILNQIKKVSEAREMINADVPLSIIAKTLHLKISDILKIKK